MDTLDANLELGPSANSDTIDAEAATSANFVLDDDALDRADSSSAQNSVNDSDLLSVVRDVVQERETGADAAAASQAEGNEGGGTSATTPKDLDEENYTDVPFHRHARFQQLLREKKSAEAEAGQVRFLNGYLSDHGVDGTDAWEVLQIRALANVDPVQAWKRAQPLVQQLMRAAGEWPVEDLQARINAGELSQAAAAEISRSRAQATAAQNRLDLEAMRARGRQTREMTAERDTMIAGWAAEREARDPNFRAKYEALQREITFLQRQEGIPDTLSAIRAQLDKAYTNITGQFVSTTVPSPKPKPAITPVTGGQQRNAAPSKPKNVLDIIRANRAGR